MYCKNCNNQISEGAKFCNHCGAVVKASDPIPFNPTEPVQTNNQIVKDKKNSKVPLIIGLIIGGVLLFSIVIVLIIFLMARLGGNVTSLSSNDPKDEPLPYWVTEKNPDPLRDSDRILAESKLAEYSKENGNAKFKIARYFYDDCYTETDVCTLSYVYVIPEEYPQVMFHYCINESKYGCELERNKTAYSDAVSEYKARIALYDLAEEMGLDTQLIYGHFNFFKGQLGADIVINNKISISDSEKLISKLVDKMNSKDYYIQVFYVGKGSNKEYKDESNGLGIVDLGAFCKRFGAYKIYTIKDEDGSIKLTNPKEVNSPFNY